MCGEGECRTTILIRDASVNHTFFTVGIMLLMFTGSESKATGVQPGVPTVVLSSQKNFGYAEVRNTDDYPVLLYTKIISLQDDPFPRVMVSNPVIRLEGKGIAKVKFIIEQKKHDATVEHIKRVIFESIPTMTVTKRNIDIIVSQNMPMIIEPTLETSNKENWNDLVWLEDKKGFYVKNNGARVVRLMPEIKIIPNEKVVQIDKTYILPGERLLLTSDALPNGNSSVEFYPVTTYGVSVGSIKSKITTI